MRHIRKQQTCNLLRPREWTKRKPCVAKALQQVICYQEIYELVVLSGWIIGGEGG
jgi:hypothetical protein